MFADEFDEMERQALAIASWGKNVNVKIPVTNTKGVFAGPLIRVAVARAACVLNVTAIMTPDSGRGGRRRARSRRARPSSPCSPAASPTPAAIPCRIMRGLRSDPASRPKAELLWASPRELLNIFQADAIGCHIITVTNDVIAKLKLVGKDLDDYSRETVEMFYKDAAASNFTIAAAPAAA